MKYSKIDRQVLSANIFLTIGWLLLRLSILNTIILSLTLIIAVLRNIFESTHLFAIIFPLQIYVTALFLTNLVYIIGNVFETIYLRLWNKQIDVRDFEKKFFKAGLTMTIFIHMIGVFMYFIN